MTRHDTPAGPAPRTGPGRPRRGHNDAVIAPPPAHRAVLVAPALGLAVFVATVVLDVVAPTTGPGARLAPGLAWGYGLLGLVMSGLATAVLWRDARQLWGWMLGWFGVFWSVDALAQGWIRYGVTEDRVLAGVNVSLWFLNRFGSFLPVTVAVLLMIFPTGRLLAGWWGRLCAAALAVGLLGATVFLLIDATGVPDPGAIPAGVDLQAWTPGLPAAWSGPLRVAGLSGLAASVLVANASVVVRYRRADEAERDRLRWLVWAVAAMVILLGLDSLLGLEQGASIFAFAVVALPCVAMTVGVVRPDLVPIRDLLARTLLYGGLAVLLVAVDLAVLAGLTAVLGERLDQRQVVVVALLLAVTLYGPLRQRLSVAVRRWALGERAAPYDVVAGLATALESADEGSEQLAAVARSVAGAFGVGFVSVEVDRGSGERLVASYGERPRQVRTLPIAYRGVEVGRLVLPSRGVRSRLSGRDEQLLADLVRQAATAARTSRLADELQDSRERLVVAREEERRRIRRDLHDGLGPALSGVVFQVESARILVDRDPEQAKERLTATATHVQDVVADVRRLVHDLRPPALDDRGLVGALGQLAESLPVETALEADDLPSLPAAAEVAAYRIAAEALTNVVRHAGADHACVHLRVEDGDLLVEVRDDGRGVPADVEAGVGLLSLRERAAELGGRTEISCPPEGGTRVRAWLPLRNHHPEERP